MIGALKVRKNVPWTKWKKPSVPFEFCRGTRNTSRPGVISGKWLKSSMLLIRSALALVFPSWHSFFLVSIGSLLTSFELLFRCQFIERPQWVPAHVKEQSYWSFSSSLLSLTHYILRLLSISNPLLHSQCLGLYLIQRRPWLKIC